MKFFKLAFSLSLFSMLACTKTNLGEDTEVDCSLSTLNFSFILTEADCGQNNGSIIITAVGGNPPYIYAVGNPTMRTTDRIEDLGAGNYTIVVTDIQCSISKEVIIASKNGFQATALLEPSGCQMANGTITAQPVNGQPPYNYSLGAITQTTSTFNNLAAGEYEVLITDATGCDFSIIETILTGVSYASTIKPIINTNCTISGCHNGSQFPDFRTYNGVKANTKNIREFTQSGFMPRDGFLTEVEKSAIACWIDDGAFDN